jgi:hypothetical protein
MMGSELAPQAGTTAECPILAALNQNGTALGDRGAK